MPARHRHHHSTERRKSFTITPESCSRSAGIRVRDALETVITMARNMQQRIRNALKHSNARTVQIHLSIDRSRVSLQVSDDGHGLGASAASTNGNGDADDEGSCRGGRWSPVRFREYVHCVPVHEPEPVDPHGVK